MKERNQCEAEYLIKGLSFGRIRRCPNKAKVKRDDIVEFMIQLKLKSKKKKTN